MNKTPFFSIIIPVYNVEQYLETCVNSIICQQFSNYEILLVDDGSPDNSPQICDELGKKYNNIKVIHKKNGGQSDARNTGLDHATGEYIIFIDSDDYWNNSEGLQKIYEKLCGNDFDILIFGLRKYYQKDNTYSNEIVPYISNSTYVMKGLMEKNFFAACSWDKVVRRKMIDKNNIRFKVNQICEDIEWCTKLLLCKPRVTVLSECIYVYRQQNSLSITSNIGLKNLNDIYQIITKYTDKEQKAADKNLEILNFMAQQYVLWMTLSNRVNRQDLHEIYTDMKRYKFLLDYCWYPYVKKVSKVKFLSFDSICFLLGKYKKYKK